MKKSRAYKRWIPIIVIGISVMLYSFITDNKETLISTKEVLTLDEFCEKPELLLNHDPKYLGEISQKLLDPTLRNNLKFQAFGYYTRAEAEYYKQDFREALVSYKTSLHFFKAIKDTIKIATTLNSIGIVNFILSNDVDATESYLEGYKYYEAKNNKLGMGQMFHNIALIYWRSGDYVKLDYYGLKAMNIYKEIGEKDYLADLYNNYAVSLVKRLRYSEGMKYYQLASKLYSEQKNRRGEASITFNIGTLFEYQNNLDSAISYYKEAHKYFSESQDTLNLVNSFQKLARYQLIQEKFESALQLYSQSKILNKKIGDKEIDMQVNKGFAACYEGLGDYQNALKYNKIYQQFNDSLTKTETHTKIAEIESKFRVTQTQKELALTKQSNKAQSVVILFVIIGTFISFVAIYFYLKSYRIEQEKRSLLLEHKVLRTQMDPHFIFNAMSALQCYIMDDKPDEAIRFLSDFSALLRLVLQYSKDELIPISKEKKILEYYLSLQNKRFDNKIRFEINIDEELIASDSVIPPMLAQPFIENSLEHGGLMQFDDAKIWVTLKKVSNRVHLTIIDNGVGIEQSLLRAKASTHKSMATTITHERLKLLNSNQKEKVDLSIQDLSHTGGRGTKVEFSIPLNN